MLMFENNKININGLLFALPDDTVVVPHPKNITHVAFFKNHPMRSCRQRYRIDL